MQLNTHAHTPLYVDFRNKTLFCYCYSSDMIVKILCFSTAYNQKELVCNGKDQDHGYEYVYEFFLATAAAQVRTCYCQ